MLYLEEDSQDSSLATSLWDGNNQPSFMPPVNKSNHERASSGISCLPCPTVVGPGLWIPQRDVTPTPIQPDYLAATSSSLWASNVPQVESVPSTLINLPCHPVPPCSDSDRDINDPEVYQTIGGGHPPTDKEWAEIRQIRKGRCWHGGWY